MVCKEDVLLWFKDLESYKRIDVMYELLNMCVPFEIRFLGSCIEEIGKHSYQEIRGSAIIANDIDKISKDTSLTQGLLDEGVRHRVLIYLSLLSSKNCQCANWFYKTLLRADGVESFILKGNCKDENLQSEFLLLFTMGLHHPAFTFDQKSFFGDMIARVIEQRECKKHLTSKPFPNLPPGFGYSNMPKPSGHPLDIPVKTASMCHTEAVVHQQHPQALLAHPSAAPIELIHMWSRPGFAGPISGAPEIAPFPPPPASPLVSQPTSPSPSRSASPHRTFPIRSAPGLPPHLVEVLPAFAAASSIPLDPLSQPILSPFNAEVKSSDDDINHVPDDKLREAPWMNSVMVRVDMKPPNGLRFASYNKVPQQYFIDQMQALNLEGENSLHCSSSSSSSNNSLNQSPPGTPTTTPAIPHHGPGRGDNKSRMNGVPQFINPCPPNINTGPPPICDATPPPPSVPTLTNCSVPYSNYPPQVTLNAIPNSAPSQVPHRTPNCYNCGATGHSGTDCNGQTIEEITQKKTYSLEYNSPLPDTDK